jgi:cytoskeletal protein CcmA (bactofilin family)
LGGGSLLAVSGTGAFDTVDANRGFEVSTTSDKNALLGIKTPEVTFDQTDVKKEILELYNRTDSTFDDISVSVPSSSFLEISQLDDLEPGVWRVVEAKATEPQSGTGSTEVTITAESESTTVTVTRSLAATTDLGYPPACPISTGASALGPQNGDPNVDIKNTEIDGDVSAENGYVELHKVSVNGGVSAGEWVDISGANNDSYVVCGSIEADGNVTIGNHMETGPITSGGNVEIGNHSTVYGDIDADGNVTTKPNAEVKGEINEGSSKGRFDCQSLSVGRDGEAERVAEGCGGYSYVGENVNENENENENQNGNNYSYTYDYCYQYENGKYRYTYQYFYEWDENANQDPGPNPNPDPNKCKGVEPDLDPDPDPDPDPP